jgi:tetratricopeptide (TPR) repeat protein
VLPILILVAWAYAPVVDAGFVWDDDDYVELNELLVVDGGLGEIWNPSSPRNPQYYPLVFTTFRIERSFYGLDPTGYHVDNVLLHMAGSVLLLFLLRRIRLPGAWLVAAAFALHPVQVESVAWVAERKNVLSGVFYFLSAHALLTFDEGRGKKWYAVSLVCFFLALTAKTITASLPIALGLLLWWKHGRIEWRRLAPLVPMLVIGFVMGMLTRNHEYTHVISQTTVLNDLTPVDRILIAGRALWFYPMKVFWPTDLAFIYERWVIDTGSFEQWVFPLLAAAFIVGIFVAYRRGLIPRGPWAAILFYGATIFPALGFVNVAPMRFSFVADHFGYLAALGSILIGTALLGALLRRLGAERAFPVIAVALALLLAVLTRQQVRHYHDLETLWAHTVELSPKNPMPLNSYANLLRKKTDPDPARQQELWELAARYSEQSLEHGPKGGESELLALNNLADLRLRQGRYTDALALADRGLLLKPDFPMSLNVRGRALWQLDRPAEAEAAFLKILSTRHDALEGRHAWDLRRRTDDASVYSVLGIVQSMQQKEVEAQQSFERAIEINPTLPDPYFRLAALHGRANRLGEAERLYRDFLKLDAPDDLRAHSYKQLAMTLGFLGRKDEALRNYEASLELVTSDLSVHQQYVEGLIEARRFRDAIAALRVGIANAPNPLGFEQRLAWLLATAPDAADRDGAQALQLAERIVRSVPSALTLSVLGAAQAETGDFEAALATVRGAEREAPAGLAGQLRDQARDYAGGRPTRL